VFPERGVVVTHAKAEEMLEDAKEVSASFFGPDGRHGEDYTLYYSNIRDNVAKRTEAFKRVLISAEPRTIGRAVESSFLR
jgi:hypothetical protein